MSHRIKIPSFNKRRDRLDQIETADATTYFADVKEDLYVHRDEPLGSDVDPDATTEEISTISPAPLPDMRRRPLMAAAGPAWTEQDARAFGRQAAERAAAAIEEQPDEDPAELLPVPRRRHLPAVGAWFADRLRPVALPAIPELAHDVPESAPTELLPAWSAQAQQSARFVLAAAATTEIPGERPDDFVEWLRAEFASTYQLCDAALAEHAATAQADLADLDAGYFQDVDRELDRLNAMTLPGWTDLETALYRTGAFA